MGQGFFQYISQHYFLNPHSHSTKTVLFSSSTTKESEVSDDTGIEIHTANFRAHAFNRMILFPLK